MSTNNQLTNNQSQTFNVHGMHCDSCSKNIQRALKKLPGVVDASVDYPTAKAIVNYNPGMVTLQQMNEAIASQGYSLTEHTMDHEKPAVQVEEKPSYRPLFTIIGLIFLTTLVISLRDMQVRSFSLENSLSYFMIGFFLVFAGFKLIDLKGFAKGYSTYDLLAQRVNAYGYIYPFIELFFGLAMIVTPQSLLLLVAEIVVMTFSGIGVAIKILKKEKFQCACLGTFLKVPLTKITLIEDFGMAALALLMILLI